MIGIVEIFSDPNLSGSVTVPQGASYMDIYMWGGGGGSIGSPGGAGAYVQGTMYVAQGTSLKVIVGLPGYNNIVTATGGGRSAIQV